MPRARRVRLLHTLPSARAGGVETFVRDLARRLDRARFELSVCVLGPDGAMSEELRSLEVPVSVMDVATIGRWRSAARFCAQVARGRFDVVHMNTGGPRLRALARACGARSVITHVHAPSDEWVPRLRMGESLGSEVRRAFADRSDRVLVSSSYMRRTLLAGCPELEGRLQLVRYGTAAGHVADPEWVAERRRALGIRPGARVTGFVGRLVPQKGIPYLLAAGERLLTEQEDTVMVIVGDGPLRDQVERFAARHAGRVIAPGERHDVREWMATFDVLAIPSEWEPLGIVALEAMAAGRPTVAFDVDGLPEVVAHEETGLLAPHRDVDALLGAIRRVLSDRELAGRMGAAGRRRVRAEFDEVSVARRLEALYLELPGVRRAVTPLGAAGPFSRG